MHFGRSIAFRTRCFGRLLHSSTAKCKTSGATNPSYILSMEVPQRSGMAQLLQSHTRYTLLRKVRVIVQSFSSKLYHCCCCCVTTSHFRTLLRVLCCQAVNAEVLRIPCHNCRVLGKTMCCIMPCQMCVAMVYAVSIAVSLDLHDGLQALLIMASVTVLCMLSPKRHWFMVYCI